MELWDLIKHLAQFSSVFPFQATGEQLSKHSALPEEDPLLLELPSDAHPSSSSAGKPRSCPCFQKDMVIRPTCTHPYHSLVEADLRSTSRFARVHLITKLNISLRAAQTHDQLSF